MKLLATMLAATFLISFGVLGCPPVPVTPPPDASDAVAPPPPAEVDAGPLGDAPTPPAGVDAGPIAADCVSACVALLKAGCSLGDAGDCAVFLTRDLGSGKVPNPSTGKPLTCSTVAGIKTRADVQKIGFVCSP
jgi:hypothetical protein